MVSVPGKMTRISVEELLDEAEFEHLKKKNSNCARPAKKNLTLVTIHYDGTVTPQWTLPSIWARKSSFFDFVKHLVSCFSKSKIW